MSKVLIISILCFVACSAWADPKLELKVYPASGFDVIDESVFSVVVSDAVSAERYWKLLMYKSPQSGRFVAINDVASYSRVAEQVINSLGLGSSRGEFAKSLGLLLWPLVENNMIVVGGQGHLDSVLMMLKDRIPAGAYENAKGALMASNYWQVDNKWQVTYVLVTNQGAIERKVFKGDVSPFRIRSLKTEVLLKDGAVPDFGYASGLEERYTNNGTEPKK